MLSRPWIPPPKLFIIPGPSTYSVLFYIIFSICHPPSSLSTHCLVTRGLTSQVCSYWLQQPGGQGHGLGVA